MTSYFFQVKDVIRESDMLIEVVDARYPQESRNFELEHAIKKHGKSLLIVMTKADLVPESFLKRASALISKTFPVVYISATKRHGTRKLFDTIRKLRNGKSVTIGVFGYPNVGKSSLINVLKGRHSAPTSPIPGYTKGRQLLRLEKNVMLIDTPGVAPLRGKKSLFLKGAIGMHQVRDIQESVINLLNELVVKGAKKTIEEHYGLQLNDPADFLVSFADKYNFRLKGNKPDTRRAAEKIYTDWLHGRINFYWL